MRKKRLLLYFVIGGLIPVLALAGMSLLSKRPDNLGVTNGELAACPSSPNCVSTTAEQASQKMEPIPFSGTPTEALANIRQALKTLPRTEVISAEDDYLHAESTSLIFRYVDDVEFLIDAENGLIHFRSASRAGHSDFGVNRRRMQRFRQALESPGK